jgi:serine/threonine protein kinase
MNQDISKEFQDEFDLESAVTGNNPDGLITEVNHSMNVIDDTPNPDPNTGESYQETDETHSVRVRSEIANPYMQSGVKVKSFLTPAQSSRLPDGKQSIPLGSGMITGVLGEGGMARVYKVWNQKLELYRAVKVIFPTENPELMERFETEIKITSKLHHPNIVETYIVGDWNGLPYIEMELVDGISLETLIEKHGKLPQVVSTAIGIQVASALAYAHTEEFLIYGRTYKGIIHRDLKPGNIMISKNGTVKLMDFGIARPSEVHLHTVSGYIVGTLPYLSPEQLAESEIDHRSDIYSLGTILYEALTGEKTFPQQTITNLMRMKVLHSYRKIDSYSIEIAPELIKTVERCLRYEKNKRFDSSKELEQTLKGIFDLISEKPLNSILKQYIHDPSKFETYNIDPVFKSKKRTPIVIVSGAILAIIGLLWLIIPLSHLQKHSTSKSKDHSIRTQAIDTSPATANIVDTLNQSTSKNGIDSIISNANSKQHKSVRKNNKREIYRSENSNNYNMKVSKTDETSFISSPIEELMKKYGTTDVVDIADAASKESDWNTVIAAIKNMPPESPKKVKGKLLLTLAYIEQGKATNATQILESFSSEDAFYVFLEGRIALTQGQDKRALNKFEEAMTRPGSVRNTQQIRNDALYYAAITYDNRFNTTRTPEARQQAMIAWNALKKAYLSLPEHFRFKLANEKLSSF